MKADDCKAYKRTSVLTAFVCVYEKKVAEDGIIRKECMHAADNKHRVPGF